jgi:hypothetical protein
MITSILYLPEIATNLRHQHVIIGSVHAGQRHRPIIPGTVR